LKQIAIDEIAIGKGHRYLTVVLNLETGAQPMHEVARLEFGSAEDFGIGLAHQQPR